MTAIAQRLMNWWSLALASALGLGLLALFLALPLFFLFIGVVYAATYGSDGPLKAACAQDTVFSRFSLLTGTPEFWQGHIAHLDRQVRGKELLPAQIEADVAKTMQSMKEAGLENMVREHAAKKTPSQRAADALRQQADAIEAADTKAAFDHQLREEIRALQVCKARAAEQLAKAI